MKSFLIFSRQIRVLLKCPSQGV